MILFLWNQLFFYQHYEVFFQGIVDQHFLQNWYQVCNTQLKHSKELRSSSFEITCRFYFFWLNWFLTPVETFLMWYLVSNLKQLKLRLNAFMGFSKCAYFPKTFRWIVWATHFQSLKLGTNKPIASIFIEDVNST